MTAQLYLLPDATSAGTRKPKPVVGAKGVQKAYGSRDAVMWVARSNGALGIFTKVVRVSKPRHNLLALTRITSDQRAVCEALFAVVVAPGDGVVLLPEAELREAIAAENAEDLVVGARWVSKERVLVLYRGNLGALVVPISVFRARPRGPKPEPEKLAITDFGQTIRLGEYEASVDAILYELDPAARRRAKKRQLREDTSLGASIRRLRLQCGVTLAEFPDGGKTVGRIERGEVRPRPATLDGIAKRLGVTRTELGGY